MCSQVGIDNESFQLLIPCALGLVEVLFSAGSAPFLGILSIKYELSFPFVLPGSTEVVNLEFCTRSCKVFLLL